MKKVEGASVLALRFLGLTALRSGEVRQARWSWLSFDSATPVMTIPGEIMKGRKTADRVAHRVPLAPAALDVLALAYADSTGAVAKLEKLPALAALRGDALIFQGRKRTVPLSDMSLSAVMRRMNADRPKGTPAPWRDPDGREAVPHGLRSSFSTWVDDTRPHEREAAERALAHQIANSASAAYRRSDMLDRRIDLMEAWAAHCTGVDGEESREKRSAGR
jgi:integrase